MLLLKYTRKIELGAFSGDYAALRDYTISLRHETELEIATSLNPAPKML